MLQAGNSVAATWRGRLSEHLGFYRLEPARIRTGALMDDPAALAALRAECALLALVLPEREPHPALYAALLALLDSLGAGVAWDPEILRFELKLLEDLGFGPEPAEAQAVLAEGARDLPAALALTARLLERHLLHPHGRALPPARADLPAALARAKMTREENQAAR
jgi:DNA repair protein RecO (recombination protein O)